MAGAYAGRVVTAASRGIGRAIALPPAETGAAHARSDGMARPRPQRDSH